MLKCNAKYYIHSVSPCVCELFSSYLQLLFVLFFLVQCEDSRCNVWQHIGCVVIPEKPMEGVLPVPPEVFYCELCRLTRADP